MEWFWTGFLRDSMEIYRLPPLPPTPNNFDELMFAWIDDEEFGILVKEASREPID